MSLKKSQVCFNEVEHTYTLGDKKLSGVTAILGKYLFAHKYDGVSESVLKKAAEKGTLIHSQMQMWINGMPFTEQDNGVRAMQMILSDDKFVESEFTVSDEAYVASQIDAIAELPDGTYELWDWKTTSVLDMDYLSWQLSIYAYLFEMQTGCVASRLMVGHIRESAKAVEVTRINDEYVEALLGVFVSGGEEFVNPIAKTPIVLSDEQQTAIDEYRAAENVILSLKAQMKDAEDKMSQVKQMLLELMEHNGVTKFENDIISITYTAPYKRDGLDTKKLKDEKPEVYEEYYKPTNVKASVTIKIKC